MLYPPFNWFFLNNFFTCHSILWAICDNLVWSTKSDFVSKSIGTVQIDKLNCKYLGGGGQGQEDHPNLPHAGM